MQLSTEEIIVILEIAVFVLLLILLYNLTFAAMSLRKVLKRADTVTSQVEQVMLKPISIADATVDWVASLLESTKKKHKPVDSKKSNSKKS